MVKLKYLRGDSNLFLSESSDLAEWSLSFLFFLSWSRERSPWEVCLPLGSGVRRPVEDVFLCQEKKAQRINILKNVNKRKGKKFMELKNQQKHEKKNCFLSQIV